MANDGQSNEIKYYAYNENKAIWFLSAVDDPGMQSAIFGAKLTQAGGKLYWVLSHADFLKNLKFLKNVGYVLHPNSSRDESGMPIGAEAASASYQAPVQPQPATEAVLGSQEKPFKVSEISSKLKASIDDVFGKLLLWIEGEISGLKCNGKGDWSFDLIEPNNTESEETSHSSGRSNYNKSNYKCAIKIWINSWTWPSIVQTFEAEKLPLPKDGDKVCVQGNVQFWNKSTSIAFNVKAFDLHYGEGEFLKAKRATEQRLINEGLYYLNQGLKKPELPFRIAVFCNQSAAGYDDFVTALKKSQFPFEVTLFKIALQGNDVRATFLEAMQQLQQIGESNFDYGVIIRGGGALIDMSAFNDYEIAKSIALSKLKFIAGIGHNRDLTILDDMLERYMTPTDTGNELVKRITNAFDQLTECEAELIRTCKEVQQIRETRLAQLSNAVLSGANGSMRSEAKNIDNLENLLKVTAQRGLDVLENEVMQRSNSLSEAVRSASDRESDRLLVIRKTIADYTSARLEYHQNALKQTVQTIGECSQNILERQREHLISQAESIKTSVEIQQKTSDQLLNAYEQLINAQDPRELMKRGFAILTQSDGNRVLSVKSLTTNETIKATLIDGSLDLSIQTIRESK